MDLINAYKIPVAKRRQESTWMT